MKTALRTWAPLLLVALLLGGCLGNADTANNRSVLPVGASRPGRDPGSDNPRQICESTMIGSEPKTVCY